MTTRSGRNYKASSENTMMCIAGNNVPIFEDYMCPCGGGQSCIVHRRLLKDWVHEDVVFQQAGLPIRQNCYEPYSYMQQEILNKIFGQ